MLAVFTFLSALLWGTFIGAKMHSGLSSNRVHLPQRDAVIGNMLFTLPVLSMLLLAPATEKILIATALLAVAGLGIGIHVGLTTYWID